MAVIRSLAVGKARKSAGNLTYQTVKGRTIAREKPAFVANPNTPLQQAQRGKMRNLVAAWRAWFSLMKPYFTVIDGYGSAYNQFVKMNMPWATAFQTDQGTGVVMYGENAYFSNGKYPQRSLEATGGSVTVADIQLQAEAEAGDRLVLAEHGFPSSNPTIQEYVLTESDIENIRNGLPVDTGFTPTSPIGWIFYSSARHTSSTLFFSAGG